MITINDTADSQVISDLTEAEMAVLPEQDELVSETETQANLKQLAEEIKESHQRVRAVTGLALVIGHKLCEAKTLVDHGQWRTWVEEECGVKERQAQRYMKLAQKEELLREINPSFATDLAITECLDLVRQAENPPAASVDADETESKAANLTTSSNALSQQPEAPCSAGHDEQAVPAPRGTEVDSRSSSPAPLENVPEEDFETPVLSDPETLEKWKEEIDDHPDGPRGWLESHLGEEKLDRLVADYRQEIHAVGVKLAGKAMDTEVQNDEVNAEQIALALSMDFQIGITCGDNEYEDDEEVIWE